MKQPLFHADISCVVELQTGVIKNTHGTTEIKYSWYVICHLTLLSFYCLRLIRSD